MKIRNLMLLFSMFCLLAVVIQSVPASSVTARRLDKIATAATTSVGTTSEVTYFLTDFYLLEQAKPYLYSDACVSPTQGRRCYHCPEGTSVIMANYTGEQVPGCLDTKSLRIVHALPGSVLK